MAQQAKVYVGDNAYSGIISVLYEQNTTSDDQNYRPADKSRNGLITIRRASDKGNDWMKWAVESTESSWLSGKIVFLNENDETIRTLIWDHGFVHQYKEGQPAMRVEDVARRIFEEVQIQAEVITVDGTAHDDNWTED